MPYIFIVLNIIKKIINRYCNAVLSVAAKFKQKMFVMVCCGFVIVGFLDGFPNKVSFNHFIITLNDQPLIARILLLVIITVFHLFQVSQVSRRFWFGFHVWILYPYQVSSN